MHGSVENGKALKNLKNLSFNKKEVWTCGHKDPCLSISGWLLVSFSFVCVCVCVCVACSVASVVSDSL